MYLMLMHRVNAREILTPVDCPLVDYRCKALQYSEEQNSKVIKSGLCFLVKSYAFLSIHFNKLICSCSVLMLGLP